MSLENCWAGREPKARAETELDRKLRKKKPAELMATQLNGSLRPGRSNCKLALISRWLTQTEIDYIRVSATGIISPMIFHLLHLLAQLSIAHHKIIKGTTTCAAVTCRKLNAQKRNTIIRLTSSTNSAQQLRLLHDSQI